MNQTLADLRNGSNRTDAMKDFLDLYARVGRAMQTQHLGQLLAYYTTDVGELGQMARLGQYTDMVHRLRRRAALESARRQSRQAPLQRRFSSTLALTYCPSEIRI